MTLLERELLEALLGVLQEGYVSEFQPTRVIVSRWMEGSPKCKKAIDLLERLGYAKPLDHERWELVWPER